MSFNPLEYPIVFTDPSNLEFSAWKQHIPFAMFLIDVLRPSVFVELGVHYGVSYCAFCQAVKYLQLDTKCYGVDAWLGDEHAGEIGQEVLQTVRSYHDPAYGGFSRLLEMTFDNAVKTFDDGTIDLLHIDGLHTYEAVKHDFEAWFPKLSTRAVVLFHDTNVRENNFGVWKLWSELKVQYPYFEFVHQHGLGVLAIGEEYPKSLDMLLKESSDQCIRMIREFFFAVGRRIQTEEPVARLRQFYERKYVEDFEVELTSRLEEIQKDFQRQQEEMQRQQEEMQRQYRIQLADVKSKLGTERDKLRAELIQKYNELLAQQNIQEIKPSQLTQLRWRFINHIAPRSTTRRRIYNLTKASISTLLHEGPIVLVNRGRRWLRGERQQGKKRL